MGVLDVSVIATSAGPVEVARSAGGGRPVLFFPGGHCSATTDCGWDFYTRLGYRVISFSRPGYGATRVGPMSAEAFSRVVGDVCAQLGIESAAAAVGVSFGGMQAVHVAAGAGLDVERLILHSCAPSTLPYPDTRAEAVAGPIVFSPVLEGVVWWFVRRLVRTDSGLRRMLANLSTLPAAQWWGDLSAADKQRARALFAGMRSRSGFVNDLQSAGRASEPARREALERVPCRSLITASPHDGGVAFAHATDFAAHIADVTLVELESPTHLFWIGPDSARCAAAVEEFMRT